MHIYVHIPLPLSFHSLVSLAGEFACLVKEINALISSFSATYRPRVHGQPLSSAFHPLLRALSRTAVEDFYQVTAEVSPRHGGLVVTVLCKRSVRKGRQFPRHYVYYIPSSLSDNKIENN